MTDKPSSKLERRVVRAAIRLAAAGHGFIFKDDRTVSDVGLAIKLENAIEDLAKLQSERKEGK